MHEVSLGLPAPWFYEEFDAMTMENATNDGDPPNLDRLWAALGRLALGGKIPLRVVRGACATLVVVSSYRRNQMVKTYVATELKTSRRVTRELLARWTESEDIGSLLEDLRRQQESGEDPWDDEDADLPDDDDEDASPIPGPEDPGASSSSP